jgi:hypothetical protein
MTVDGNNFANKSGTPVSSLDDSDRTLIYCSPPTPELNVVGSCWRGRCSLANIFLFGAYALFANIELRGVRGERLLGGKTRPPCSGEVEFTCEIVSVNSLFFLVLALPKWRRRLLLWLFRLLL